MYQRSNKMVSVGRLIAMVGMFISLAGGVTFASLQSQQAALLNNTISSATADLRIGTSATSFAASRTGFDFKDLVPGGVAQPLDGNSFYLKNYGTAELSVKIAVSSIPLNTSTVDLSKVSLQLTREDTLAVQTFSVRELVDTFVSGGVLLTDTIKGGVTAHYTARMSMTADAFSGQSALIDDVDIVFTGQGK